MYIFSVLFHKKVKIHTAHITGSHNCVNCFHFFPGHMEQLGQYRSTGHDFRSYVVFLVFLYVASCFLLWLNSTEFTWLSLYNTMWIWKYLWIERISWYSFWPSFSFPFTVNFDTYFITKNIVIFTSIILSSSKGPL